MKFSALSTRLAESKHASIRLVGKPARDKPTVCPDCGTTLAALRRLPPHRYRLEGTNPGDFLTDGMVLAFSERFVNRFRDSGLTSMSFSSDPIELAGAGGAFLIGHPPVTRTLLDEAASGLVVDEVVGCEQCRVVCMKSIKQIVIQESTWLGHDFFLTSSLMNVVLVTENFVEFVHQHHFSNFRFISQEDFSESFDY